MLVLLWMWMLVLFELFCFVCVDLSFELFWKYQLDKMCYTKGNDVWVTLCITEHCSAEKELKSMVIWPVTNLLWYSRGMMGIFLLS